MVILTLIAIGVNLIRGTPNFDSIVGLDTCGMESWSLLIGLTILCILLTLVNFREVKAE